MESKLKEQKNLNRVIVSKKDFFLFRNNVKVLKKKVNLHNLTIRFTNNNCLATVSLVGGKVLLSTSIGKVGFRNTRKGSHIANLTLAGEVIRHLENLNISSIAFRIIGFSQYLEAFLQSFEERGLTVIEIKNETPIPHNGCRRIKKKRR